ncbi:HD domain-containing protein [Arenibacter latericius]|uniref:HD domain-containing protein n=1 Tax=Arenibacter latericius TaxID=86104 RepID=UPI000401C2E9|nr:HD domain-containing protein [Arenibacter latericius]
MEKEALEFARKAHGNQQRKYKEELYIAHPILVAEMLSEFPHTSEMICAAYLHDVVEDTEVSLKQINKKFGKKVAKLVEELTDEFTKEKYPELNRRWRKKKETERIANISSEAQSIKLADIIDNLPSISKNDPGFAKRYIPEMKALVQVLKSGHPQLLERAQKLVK